MIVSLDTNKTLIYILIEYLTIVCEVVDTTLDTKDTYKQTCCKSRYDQPCSLSLKKYPM